MSKSQTTTADALVLTSEQRSAGSGSGKTMGAFKELITLIKTNATSYMMYFALVVIMLVFQIWTEGKFFTAQNITNLFNQAAYVAVLAIGMTIILILKHIDLSCGYVAGLSGAVAAILMEKMGVNVWLAMLIVLLMGLAIGFYQGTLVTKFGIPAILAGILTQFALYSINLHIMGMAANKAVSVDKYHLLISSRNIPLAILTSAIVAIALVSVFYWYFGTEQGSALRATGNNPAMSRALGINIDNMKVLGLSISNGVVALAGGLMSQYQGFADINMGRGAIVIGLAAVIIGEVIGNALLKKYINFYFTLSFTVIGGVIYYLVVVIVLWLRLNSNDLKLFTAIVVALFLAVPYLRGQRISSFAKFKQKGAKNHA